MKLILVIVTAMFFFNSDVFAAGGTEIGGGGKAVVCLNADQSLKSIETLDLWEERVLYNRELKQSNETLAESVDSKLKLLSESYPFRGRGPNCKDSHCVLQWLQGYADQFLSDDSKVRRLRNVRLPLTEDSFDLGQPKDCEMRQVVNYQPSGLIFVDQDLFEMMDVQNKAALIIHEAYYATLRLLAQETNSIRTRRAVGYVFSGGQFTLSASPPKSGLRCKNDGSEEFLPTEIIFTREISKNDSKAEINIYPMNIFGSKMIGLEKNFENYSMFSQTEAENLWSGKCSDYSGMYFEVILTLTGPVEFDRRLKITTFCQNGDLKKYLTDVTVGIGSKRTTELYCQEF